MSKIYTQAPVGGDGVDSIDYWRNRIFNVIARSGIVIGVLPILVSLRLSFKADAYHTIVVDFLLLAGFISLLMTQSISYSSRVKILILTYFGSGAFFSYEYGPFAVGFFISFAVPIIASVLLNRRSVLIILIINSLTVTAIVIGNVIGRVDWVWNFDVEMAILFLSTFLFLSATSTFAIVETMTGLFTVNNELNKSRVRLKNAYIDSVSRLVTAAEFKDQVTGKHIARIGNLSALLASKMGFDSTRIEEIYYASLMHDIGKIGIPDSVLKSEGSLTEDQRVIMNTHTTYGAAILENSDLRMIQTAERIAHYHHERWDGSGYPEGLRGTQIPIEARIVAICDVYDALTSQRSYKETLSRDEALAYIFERKGTAFDPQLADLFLENENEFNAIKHKVGAEDRLDEVYTSFLRFRDQSLFG